MEKVGGVNIMTLSVGLEGSKSYFSGKAANKAGDGNELSVTNTNVRI